MHSIFVNTCITQMRLTLLGEGIRFSQLVDPHIFYLMWGSNSSWSFHCSRIYGAGGEEGRKEEGGREEEEVQGEKRRIERRTARETEIERERTLGGGAERERGRERKRDICIQNIL